MSSRAVVASVGILASASLLLLAVRKIDVDEVARTLRGAEPAYAALAGLAIALFYGLQAARWSWIVRAYSRPRYRTLASFVLAGVATNNVLPGRVGDLLRAHWLSRSTGLPHERAFASVVVDRGSDVLVLVLALLIGFPAVAHPSWAVDLVASAVVAAALVVGALVAARLYARRAPDAVPPSALRHRRLRSFIAAVSGLVDRRVAVGAACLGLLAWASWSLAAWLAARSLGIDVSLGALVFAAAAINLGVAIPSSPGFVGTYQWLAVAALALGGVGAEEAFAFSIVLHALWFVPTTLAGGALALRGLPWRRMPAVEPAASLA